MLSLKPMPLILKVVTVADNYDISLHTLYHFESMERCEICLGCKVVFTVKLWQW